MNSARENSYLMEAASNYVVDYVANKSSYDKLWTGYALNSDANSKLNNAKRNCLVNLPL